MSYHLNFVDLLPYWPQFLKGLWLTIELTVIATIGGLIMGTLTAGARVTHNRLLRIISGIYVEVIRNTPFIVQLFFIYFGIPALGVKLSAMEAGLIAMVVNLGAYSAEIIRSGIDVTPKGQYEAGRTLGLNRLQVFWRIVIPPAFMRIYTPLISQCIIVMLGSSVVSQISVEELTYSADFVQSRTFLSFESYFVATAAYLILAILMRQLLNRLAKRAFRGAPL
ncbi:amino acid ABC transporter permease [Celerinatantimonas sp. MCCC 1A17872]|uniref:amino acid ABC transporter permease n=1 Tax=Celerinatantimonas sp. MCCC 1A17872 TaxID=3177514 RepID=UPI0038BF8A8E